MTMPATRAISTCQLWMPRANSDPAVTYPPTLCTSDIQNAKMLYEDQVCFDSGARSTLVRAGSYPSFMTGAPGASSATVCDIRILTAGGGHRVTCYLTVSVNR